MEEQRYIIDCYTKDAMIHGFPEHTYTCVSPKQLAEIIANCTTEYRGIEEVRITFEKKEPDYEWAKYWRLEAQNYRDYEDRLKDEITRYLPFINFMSFAGPKAIVDWIFKNVDIKEKEDGDNK